MIKDISDIKDNIRQKYMLDTNHIAIGSQIYFIFMEESRNLEKGMKKGKIIRVNDTTYTISSDEIYTIPKYLVFLNRYKAQEVIDKINIDELRFLL